MNYRDLIQKHLSPNIDPADYQELALKGLLAELGELQNKFLHVQLGGPQPSAEDYGDILFFLELLLLSFRDSALKKIHILPRKEDPRHHQTLLLCCIKSISHIILNFGSRNVDSETAQRDLNYTVRTVMDMVSFSGYNYDTILKALSRKLESREANTSRFTPVWR